MTFIHAVVKTVSFNQFCCNKTVRQRLVSKKAVCTILMQLERVKHGLSASELITLSTFKEQNHSLSVTMRH